MSVTKKKPKQNQSVRGENFFTVHVLLNLLICVQMIIQILWRLQQRPHQMIPVMVSKKQK